MQMLEMCCDISVVQYKWNRGEKQHKSMETIKFIVSEVTVSEIRFVLVLSSANDCQQKQALLEIIRMLLFAPRFSSWIKWLLIYFKIQRKQEATQKEKNR